MKLFSVYIFAFLGTVSPYTPPALGDWEGDLTWASIFALTTIVIGLGIALVTLLLIAEVVVKPLLKYWGTTLPNSIK